MEYLGNDFDENVQRLDELLGSGRCFDMITRGLIVGQRRAKI